MRHLTALIFSLVALMLPGVAVAQSPPTEPRIALVIGNTAYAQGPLKTPLADAGLVATALNSVGFEIVEGADLGQADLRARFREFLDKVQAAGPDTIALVYFNGYALEYEGENYLVPVDARLEREGDIPIDAVRMSDVLRPLAAAPGRAKVLVIDAARPLPFALAGAKLARGLSAMEAPPGTLVAMSAGPGMLIAGEEQDYGVYAKALAEMVRADGLDLGAIFMRTRVRTHVSTQGAQTPWHVSALSDPVVLVSGGASQDATQPAPVARRDDRPLRDLGPDDAYAFAVERDDLPTYVEYVRAYPRSPYARRIWAQIRARRESLAWLRAVERDTPEAYWTYLRRYPGGVYAFDAQRRLRRLAAREEPPLGFAPVEFADVPPPLPDEPADFYATYDPGPPLPRLIGPPPAFFVNLPPPPPPRGPRLLPVPLPIPLMHGIGRPPPPRAYAPPMGALAPTGPVPGVRPGPGGVAPIGGQHRPPGLRQPGATTTITPPGGAPPKPGPKPPGAVTTITPPNGPSPQFKKKLPEHKPPGVVTTTPPGGPPPRRTITGPNPPTVTTTAPTGVQPPKHPTPPGPPTVATQGVKPGLAAKQPPPPGPQKRCPIVNGVEKCPR